jgi:hypothetical protein
MLHIRRQPAGASEAIHERRDLGAARMRHQVQSEARLLQVPSAGPTAPRSPRSTFATICSS